MKSVASQVVITIGVNGSPGVMTRVTTMQPLVVLQILPKVCLLVAGIWRVLNNVCAIVVSNLTLRAVDVFARAPTLSAILLMLKSVVGVGCP